MAGSPSRYLVNRQAGIRSFVGRRDYLRYDQKSARFCQVLQAAVDPPPVASGIGGSPWAGFPWLTMVFGSGALKLHDGAAARARELAAGVGGWFASHDFPHDYAAEERERGASPLHLASRIQLFTEALVQDRLRGEVDRIGSAGAESGTANPGNPANPANPANPGNPGERDKEAALAAGITSLTYLLTEIYYVMQSAQVVPLSHWDDTVAVLEAGQLPPRFAPLAKTVLAVIDEVQQEIIAAQSESLNPDEALAALANLLQRVQNGLERHSGAPGRPTTHTLRLEDVRTLTEVAWYLLTKETAIYPGWTELLVQLALSQGDLDEVSPSRPRFDSLSLVPYEVSKLFAGPTAASWSNRRSREAALDDDEVGARFREDLYLAAADVLWSQATATPPDWALPPAVAFVTSFDIELEMALWRTAPTAADGAPVKFWVVVPVHVRDGLHSDEAELCWFFGQVEVAPNLPHDVELERLMTPTDWRMFTQVFNVDELRGAPIVVHLSGAPLLSLTDSLSAPEMAADFAAAGLALTELTQVDPAVTVDEYLALRQSEAELLWRGAAGSTNEAARVSRELPARLLTGTDLNPRYWLSMGVPVADIAIRHRFLSQLTRQRIADATAARPVTSAVADDEDSGLGDNPHESTSTGQSATMSTRVRGAAINARIGADETGLLYWTGLDVVDGADCNQFAGDLREYARHVRHSGPLKKPPLRERCRLCEEGQ